MRPVSSSLVVMALILGSLLDYGFSFVNAAKPWIASPLPHPTTRVFLLTSSSSTTSPSSAITTSSSTATILRGGGGETNNNRSISVLLASLWGSGGVIYILAKAIKRVLPIAMEPFAEGAVPLSQLELG